MVITLKNIGLEDVLFHCFNDFIISLNLEEIKMVVVCKNITLDILYNHLTINYLK